ncbi:hypothetical protein TGDOM2_228440 [Toxoplasma gondii GAB2-2007-GAL-DOM2]|uniref:Uncharacterized protein n=5 Tax=Toxoplasma gondii TaxID=5811 RepID=S7WDB3_TOXGG|nr:hypothetical protein TGGT1_228440 [Toxoplasma gondii GT1]KFG44927.1 hypothetical protein TGDOM2_228440 [Toxoplasma gondii GAB2-2007-GAL-DOM2]KFG52226.1 hypothetical protein TGFOU_228440 [Toxoplasma gondii FOU]PUA90925.1 hypothetical protein TGBR9_228440 [Toxoplasma gondii TgCATBr9]RQX74286.1 hypothetical protein TGCAST_228440 [Toxoplasma gondii CAST]
MDIPDVLPTLVKGRKLVEDFHWDQREADLRQTISKIASKLAELHREDAHLRQKKFINEERRKRRLLVTDSSFPSCLIERTSEAAPEQGASHGVKPLSSSRSYCPSTLSRRSIEGLESTSGSSRSLATNYCGTRATVASRGSLRSSQSQCLKKERSRGKRMLVPLPHRTGRCMSRPPAVWSAPQGRPSELQLVNEMSGGVKEYPMYDDAEIGLANIGEEMDKEMAAVPKSCRDDDDVMTTSEILELGNKTVESYLARTVALADSALERDQASRIEQFRRKFCIP